jgi:hypothetical protein
MSLFRRSIKNFVGKTKKYDDLSKLSEMTPEEIINLHPKEVSSDIFDESCMSILNNEDKCTALLSLQQIKKSMKNVNKDMYDTRYKKEVNTALNTLNRIRNNKKKTTIKVATLIDDSLVKKQEMDDLNARYDKLTEKQDMKKLTARYDKLMEKGGKRKTKKHRKTKKVIKEIRVIKNNY